MSEQSVLSEEELDALRAEGREGGAADATGETRPYDFRDPSRMLNNRLPGLDKVHEAFAAGMQVALHGMLSRPVEIEVGDTSLTRLGDYQASLPMPVSVHAAQVQGREQSMMLVADGGFVYSCVDAFFGGRGGASPTSEREFSASERRLTGVLAQHVFRELASAWSPICALKFAEAQAAKGVQAGGGREDQILVVSHFRVDLMPGTGEFHLSMPYSLLDSLRTYLTAGPRSEESSRQWRARFSERVVNANIDVRAMFQGVRITFGELVALQAGDFIPMNAQNRIHVVVGKRALYVAEPGTSNGQAAAKVLGRVEPVN
jgi:flagellar motor switch protein FliM